uniref:rhomboid protease n=1 Tax=Falco tinnunculus TaxID=100819 RepID=A0A8C4U041_FALTI
PPTEPGGKELPRSSWRPQGLAAPRPLRRGSAGVTLSTWRPGQDAGRIRPAAGRAPHPGTAPGAPRAPTVLSGLAARRSPGAAPGGASERLPRPRRRAPKAAPARWRPAAPEGLGARGGAQHGVAVLGPRLRPAAVQQADGAAGTAAGLPPGTAAARGAPRRQRRRGAARPAAPAPQPLPAAAAPRRPPLAAPPAQAAPLRRGGKWLGPGAVGPAAGPGCQPGPGSEVRRGRARLPRPGHAASRLTVPAVAQFTGSAFGCAAIWQYESLKSRVQTYLEEARADWLDKIRPQKRGDFRKQVNSWWNNLTEGQRTVTGIIAANVFVFCLWRLPGMRRIMFTYFTSDPSSRALCSPMLLSTFSHFSLFHMAANMYVLWSFSSSIVSLLGCEQFIAVYLSAGVISTFVSYVAKMATGRFEPSLGASGAIMTVLAAVCAKMPEAKLAIIFLPMFTFTAGNALKAIIAFDTAGLALGWRLFDHAAHLGGALFGIWYITYGHELIWKNREPLVKAWHEMRTKNAGKGGGGRSN